MLLAYKEYTNTTALLISYFCINLTTAFLFLSPPSIISFLKYQCQQMISSLKESITALENKMRQVFALTQPKRSNCIMTKYLKPLQGGI